MLWETMQPAARRLLISLAGLVLTGCSASHEGDRGPTKDDVVCDLSCGDGRIVSHEFAIGDLTPDKTVEATSRADGRKHTIYLWTCPLSPENH